MTKFKIYLKSIMIPVLVGGLVGFLISGSMDYSSLQKPFLAPPAILFPIVWTILYILMGVSYGILESNSLMDWKDQFIYYFQLFVNALWPIFFFLLNFCQLFIKMEIFFYFLDFFIGSFCFYFDCSVLSKK